MSDRHKWRHRPHIAELRGAGCRFAWRFESHARTRRRDRNGRIWEVPRRCRRTRADTAQIRPEHQRCARSPVLVLSLRMRQSASGPPCALSHSGKAAWSVETCACSPEREAAALGRQCCFGRSECLLGGPIQQMLRDLAGSAELPPFRANEVSSRIGQDACVRGKAQLGLHGADAPAGVRARVTFRGGTSCANFPLWKDKRHVRFPPARPESSYEPPVRHTRHRLVARWPQPGSSSR